MSQTYIYSVSGNISVGFLDQVQLGSEINALGLSQTYCASTVIGDVLTLYFTGALSGGEKTSLDTTLSSHVPIPSGIIGGGEVENITPHVTTITTATYKENGVFYFPGKNALNVLKITSTSSITTTGSYFIKIFDLTNGNIICEANLSNTTEAECDLGTISNLSTKKAKWQILTKSARTGTIKNIAMYY